LGTHPSASSGSGASIPYGLVARLFGCLGLALLQVSAITLEGGDDVHNLGGTAVTTALTGADGAAVHHHTGTVQTAEGDERAGHVLVAARNDDHAVEPMSTGRGLDLVGDEVARLQRVAHWL
jgi:hypothetical protein